MDNFVIPTVAASLLVLLEFFSPYVTSLLVSFDASSRTKKIVALVVSFIASGGLIAVGIWAGWVHVDNAPVTIIGIVVMGFVLQQTAYRNFLKESADEVARTKGFFARAA